MFGVYRTLLAFMVVFQHLAGVPVIGIYAVFGFYTLSGYLMTLIMQKNYGYTPLGKFRYALNRFLRIYPMYWVSIIFGALLILYFTSQDSTAYSESFYLPGNVVEFLRNIFLFFPVREIPRLTPPAWALTVELFYYVLIGLGLSRSRKLVLYWLGASAIFQVAAVLYFSGSIWDRWSMVIPMASLPFATGAFIFHYKNEMMKYWQLVTARIGVDYSAFILFCCMLLNWSAGYVLGQATGFFFYTNYLICAVLVLVLSEQKLAPFISRRFDKWMGDLSYPIYLIHFQAGFMVIMLCDYIGINMQRPGTLLAFLSIPPILLLSWAMTKGLEQPIETIRSRVKRANLSTKPQPVPSTVEAETTTAD